MIAELLRSHAMNMEHANRLTADLNEQQMVSQPAQGVNHPAWIIGHLALSFQMIGGELGLKSWLPADWVGLFETGSDPATTGSGYPTKAELVHALAEGEQHLTTALGSMKDEDLDEVLPDEQHRYVFPTLGFAVLHILTVHTATHLGQLSAWRRMIGLPRVADPL